MTLSEISDKIHQILWGKSFVDVCDQDDIEHTFILRSLSSQEQNEVKYVRRKELALARHVGILCDNELKEIYHRDGVWTEENDNRIEILRDGIGRIGSQIKDFEFLKSKKQRLQRLSKKYAKELKELLNTRMSLFNLSAEQRAEEVGRRHVVFLTTQTPDEKQFWNTQEQFNEYTDLLLLWRLAKSYYEENQFSEIQIREIARAGEWRFRWHASKKGESLFGRSIADWSESQNSLVFWSQYYDSVYDSLDRPSNHVIENDASCDAWVEDQNKKMGSSSKSSSKSALGNKTATKTKDHQEVFMMVQKGDEESVKEIQEMNPSSVRKKLRRENEQIQKSGKRIKEWNLGTRSSETPSNVIRKGHR